MWATSMEILRKKSIFRKMKLADLLMKTRTTFPSMVCPVF